MVAVPDALFNVIPPPVPVASMIAYKFIPMAVLALFTFKASPMIEMASDAVLADRNVN